MRILCFGDSNTYGYDPRGFFGNRYDSDAPPLQADPISSTATYEACCLDSH